MLGGERGAAEEAGEADDAVDGGADLVADDGEELALGAVGGFGGLLGVAQGELGLFAHGDIVADGLVFEELAVAVLDGAVGPLDDARGAVGGGEGGLESGGLGPGVEHAPRGEAVGEHGPGLAEEFGAFAAEELGVGAVDESEAAVGFVAADEVVLVLDDGAVAGLGFLEAAGHLLDLAGEAHDLVGVVGDGVGIGAIGGGAGGGGLLVDLLELGDEGAVEDVAGENEQDAPDEGEADDPVGGAEALAQIVVGGDDDQGDGEAGREAEDHERLAADGHLHGGERLSGRTNGVYPIADVRREVRVKAGRRRRTG